MTTKDFILLGAGYAAGRMSKKMQAGPIGAVSGKYYIEYKAQNGIKRKEVFDKIPKGVYYAGGFQNPSDKGKAYVMKLTNSGTALIPLMIYGKNKQYKRK